MPYPIITPGYFAELTDPNNPENENVSYNVLTTPAAIEYIFPLNQERLIKKLMDTPDVLSYKMRNLKPDAEEEFMQHGKELIDENPVLQHYWAIKTLTMNILQNRNYVFEKRMLLLNYAYKTIQGMLDQMKEELIPQFIAAFTKEPKHDEVMKYFSEIKPNFALSMCDALSLFRSMPKCDEWNKVCDDIFRITNNQKDLAQFNYVEADYLKMKKAYYEDFLKGKEHYIEQVMVNYVWTYCMPYADLQVTLWENYIFFNIIFNAIKVMLTIYTYDKEDKDAAFIEAVKAFDTSMRLVNGGSVVKHIVDVNAKEGLNNNGDMAIMAMS